MGFVDLNNKGNGVSSGIGISSDPAATTAFGEPLAITITPVFQLDGLYGLPEDAFYRTTDKGGVTEVDSNGLMTAKTSVTASSFANLTSLRSVRYRPGQGSMARFTAMFPQGGVAGYQQLAGYLNQSDALAVGFDGENFGILRRYNSHGEAAKFEITAAATGAETVTITLNNETYDVSVTNASGDADFSAAEIAKEFNDNHASDAPFIADVIDNYVYFIFHNGHPFDMTGAFSFSSTGALTATYSTLHDGITPNDTWVHQDSFSLDTLDGNGPSGMTIDPTKLNVYQIDFRWLGVGRIRFSIEDEATGALIPFHEILFSNQNTQVHIANPSMRVGYRVISITGSGTEVSVKGASILGAIQGTVNHNFIPTAVSNTRSGLNSAGTIYHMISMKNNLVNELGTINKLNQREIIFHNISAGCVASSTTPAEIIFYKRVESADLLTFQTANSDGAASCSKTETTLTPGTGHVVAAFTGADSSTINIDLTKFRLVLAPGETMSIGIKGEANLQDADISVVYSVE
jgi:hypothetical protein